MHTIRDVEQKLFGLQWSPDGEWVMAVDTMNRLVVVSADGAMGPYLVGGDISEPA